VPLRFVDQTSKLSVHRGELHIEESRPATQTVVSSLGLGCESYLLLFAGLSPAELVESEDVILDAAPSDLSGRAVN
jgi:hypothetical protein